jgi:large conductance mechanosensitive channel
MATKTTKSTKTAAARARAARLATATKNQGGGFISFVREQGVIGLAVGLAIGTAAGASVKVIVDQFISPLVALLTQGIDLNSLKWVIKDATEKHGEVAIGWGAILSSVITLLATAFVIYWLVHIAKLDRLDRKKDS